MRQTLLIFLCVSLAGLSAFGAEYGEKTRFSKGKAVVYPDFEVVYLGTRHVDHPVFKPGFTFYDFDISRGDQKQKISWSSGTGLIDAVDFQFAGRTYCMELKGFVSIKGWMADDEMIIWKQKDWLKASRPKR